MSKARCVARLMRRMAGVTLALLAIGCNNGSPRGPSPVAKLRPLVVATPPPVTPPPPPAPAAAPLPETPHELPYAELAGLVPEELKPNRLRLHNDEHNLIHGFPGSEPYVSEDGSTGIVLVEANEGSAWPKTLLVRSLDRSSADMDFPLLNRECDPPNYACRVPETEQQVRIANKILAKHSWVGLRYYVPHQPERGSGANCGTQDLTRHFRIPGYEILFKAPRIRIVRDDGSVVADRDYEFEDPGTPDACKARPYLNSIGIDTDRRVMTAVILSCWIEGCRGYRRFPFFRLPPPTNKPVTK